MKRRTRITLALASVMLAGFSGMYALVAGRGALSNTATAATEMSAPASASQGQRAPVQQRSAQSHAAVGSAAAHTRPRGS